MINLTVVILCMMLSGCIFESTSRQTTPASLEVAPPWLYSKPVPQHRRPVAPGQVQQPEQVEVRSRVQHPGTVQTPYDPQQPRTEDEIESQIQQIQTNIDELKKNLKDRKR